MLAKQQQLLIDNLAKFGLPPFVSVLDIETPTQDVNSGILTIGAVIRNVITGEYLSKFYQRVYLPSNNEFGRVVRCEDTLVWWNQQNKLAYYEAWENPEDRVPLDMAINNLNVWLQSYFSTEKECLIFANGPEFDNVIVSNAARACGLKLWGNFAGYQSLRTINWMARLFLGKAPKYELIQKGTTHHALHDAEFESDQIVETISDLVNEMIATTVLNEVENERTGSQQ